MKNILRQIVGHPKFATASLTLVLFSLLLILGVATWLWPLVAKAYTAPKVQITAPTHESDVSGVVTVSVGASDPDGIARVEFFLDQHLHGIRLQAPYTFTWDTTQGINSRHMLTAFAYDALGNRFSHQVEVIVKNTGVSDAPPTVSISTPSHGATVSGFVLLSASATDDVGLEWVKFYIDSKLVATVTSTPYRYSWDTTREKNGIHYLSARAKDRRGYNSHATSTAMVKNTGRGIGVDQVRLSWESDPKTSAVVQWRSLQAIPSTVAYGVQRTSLTSIATGTSVVLDGAYQHTVRLTNLHSGTRYYYKVAGVVYSFVTASESSDARSFKFLAVGNQGFNPEAQRLVQVMRQAGGEFMVLLGDFSYQDRTPFCTHLSGDYIQLPEREYCVSGQEVLDGWMNMDSSLWNRLPTAFVFGNHEGGKKAQPYLDRFATIDPLSGRMRELFGRSVYSFDYGPIHFVVLNSTGERDELKFSPGQPQYEWLRDDLEAHRDAKWKVVMAHHSPFGAEPTGNMQKIVPLIDEFGVDFVLTAHTHLYERMFPMHGQPPQVTNRNLTGYVDPDPIYVVVGSGGNRVMGAPGGALLPSTQRSFVAKRFPWDPFFSEFSFIANSETGTSSIAVQVIGADGVVADTFTVEKR
ncbi:MAG: metallophosphoesterase [Parcubacteria group bacterium]|nr:metallophosphoesterase [Parcubacteria group bacterium]